MKRAGMKDKWRLNSIELSADEIIELNDGLEFYLHNIMRQRDELWDKDDRTDDEENLYQLFKAQADMIRIMYGKIVDAEEELE